MSNIEEKYLMNNLVGDYQKLTQDIIMYENELESRDRKWQEIGGIKNPNFKEDRKREFINNKIGDLRDQRNRIWNFLTIQFNQNTKIRDGNFKQLQKLNKDISKKTGEIAEKKEAIQNSKGFRGKQVREHQILVYKNNTEKEMIYLHSIGLVCLLISCGLMIGTVLGKVETSVLYFGVGSILGIYLLYLIKVIYVDNINRNTRFSDEVDFNKPDKKLIAENARKDASNSEGCRPEEELRPEVENDLDLEKIKRTVVLNNESCLKNSTATQ
tara:strand:- start:293 stop:1102 length:810 start_codon:yes stop_codon:yes gene_type:complete